MRELLIVMLYLFAVGCFFEVVQRRFRIGRESPEYILLVTACLLTPLTLVCLLGIGIFNIPGLMIESINKAISWYRTKNITYTLNEGIPYRETKIQTTGIVVSLTNNKE